MRSPRLDVEILLRRHGWLPLAALLLASAGSWLHLVATPELLAASQAQRQTLAAARAGSAVSVAAPEAALINRRYRDFRGLLTRRKALPEVVKAFFAAAERNGVLLQQMEYSLARPAAGEYQVYRISVPLTGSYGAARQFAQDILAQLPSAALEEAAFRRGSITSPATEAKLRFAVYLKEED